MYSGGSKTERGERKETLVEKVKINKNNAERN